MAYRLIFGEDEEQNISFHTLEFVGNDPVKKVVENRSGIRPSTPKSVKGKKRPTISFVLDEIEKDLDRRDSTHQEDDRKSVDSAVSEEGITFTIFGRVDVFVKGAPKPIPQMRCYQLDLTTTHPTLRQIKEGFALLIEVESKEIDVYEVIYEENQRKESDVELSSGRFGRLLSPTRLEEGIANGSFFELQRSSGDRLYPFVVKK